MHLAVVLVVSVLMIAFGIGLEVALDISQKRGGEQMVSSLYTSIFTQEMRNCRFQSPRAEYLCVRVGPVSAGEYFPSCMQSVS